MTDFTNGHPGHGARSTTFGQPVGPSSGPAPQPFRQAPQEWGQAPPGWGQAPQQHPAQGAGFGPTMHGPGQGYGPQQGYAPHEGYGQQPGYATQGYGQGPGMPPHGYPPAPRGPAPPPGGFGPAWPVPGPPALTYGPPRTAQQPVPTPAPKPRRRSVGKMVAAMLVVGVLAGGGAYVAFGGTSRLLGSGSGTTAPEVRGTGSDSDPATGLGGGQAAAPVCPFTAEQVTELVGQPMVDQGSCLFGDGKGVATLTVGTSSATATEVTYDYSREQATKTYTKVHDIGQGHKGYLAYKELGAEAVVIGPKGGFTISMSSFERFDGASYEPVLEKVVDALAL
ncbi:MAG: hypothetical protein V7633_4941 [Pseudonocardia sp.]|jgi:hypothetical protein